MADSTPCPSNQWALGVGGRRKVSLCHLRGEGDGEGDGEGEGAESLERVDWKSIFVLCATKKERP